MERYKVDYQKGLSDEQVNQRKKEGLINVSNHHINKTYQEIIKDNIFTLFNLVNLILAIFIFITGSYRNMLFLGVVLSNILIGTIQEIKAKKIVDKIALIVSNKAHVIRNGVMNCIALEELVLDDIIQLKSGNQIVSDAILVHGELEVDESLLTGESEIVIKKEGDYLYSGSFVVGSMGYAQIEKVGDNNYATQMVKDAKKQVRYPSQLRDNLNKIIKVISILIIPLGCMLFFKQFYILNDSFNASIISTSAALIGMIPEGLVILTSIALAVGSINLAKHKTLVQEMYCLETLARVDVLCLDKTGTITEGNMEVAEVIGKDKDLIDIIMKNIIQNLDDDNPTFKAMENYFKTSDDYHLVKAVPFNSKRKYSGCIFEEGTYYFGAYEFLIDEKNDEEEKMINEYAKKGYRVLSVVKEVNQENILIGLICLLDKIRDSAKETLQYFKEQGVDIKVISGDHALSVSQIAKRAGLERYDDYVDATTLNSKEDIDEAMKKYQVFGRVTPNQKKMMVQSLKDNGHIVGMSGDGVNDVLAFKEADISIAMASGSDMARSSANLVLLDSNFDALPYVLYEGRRVINNVQRVATLFLTKTFFSSILALLTLLVSFKYPFSPIHLTFVSSLTIGIPAFFFALEPNKKRVEKNFLENVLKVSLPASISVALSIIYIYICAYFLSLSTDIVSQLALIAISLNGLIVLFKVAYPFTKLRFIIYILVFIFMIVGLKFGNYFFEFSKIYFSNIWIHVILITILLLSISKLGNIIVERIYHKKQKLNVKKNSHK